MFPQIDFFVDLVLQGGVLKTFARINCREFAV